VIRFGLPVGGPKNKTPAGLSRRRGFGGIRLVSLPDFAHPSGARAYYYYAYYSACYGQHRTGLGRQRERGVGGSGEAVHGQRRFGGDEKSVGQLCRKAERERKP